MSITDQQPLAAEPAGTMRPVPPSTTGGRRRLPRARVAVPAVIAVLAIGAGLGIRAATMASTSATTTTAPAPGPVPCALTAAAEACWASHTGVPGWTEAQIVAGESPLTHTVGDLTITVDGSVISDRWIDGCIAVKANNVTVRRSLVRSPNGCKGGNGHAAWSTINTGNGDGGAGAIANLTIVDTEIDTMKPAADIPALSTNNFTCTRCNIHGATKLTYVDTAVVIQDSYLHDPNENDGAQHLDGVFYDGGAGGIRLLHNFITMRGPTGYVTAAVGLVNDYPGTDVVVDSNFLEGASGADLEGGATPGKACSPGCYFDHITVRNNAFSPDNQSGTAQAVNLDTGAPGFTWADNIDSEIGAVLARP